MVPNSGFYQIISTCAMRDSLCVHTHIHTHRHRKFSREIQSTSRQRTVNLLGRCPSRRTFPFQKASAPAKLVNTDRKKTDFKNSYSMKYLCKCNTFDCLITQNVFYISFRNYKRKLIEIIFQ